MQGEAAPGVDSVGGHGGHSVRQTRDAISCGCGKRSGHEVRHCHDDPSPDARTLPAALRNAMSGTWATEGHVHIDMREFVEQLARDSPSDARVIAADNQRR
jgi:hypothetical protein